MSYTIQIVHSGSAVETYLAVDCNTSSTSITLNDGTGWPSPTGAQIAYGCISPVSSGESKFTYTSRSGNVLSGVTWSADGTTSASTYTAGAATVVRHGFTALEATEANDAVRNTLGRIDAANQFLVSDSSTTLAKKTVAQTRTILGLGTAAVLDTGYTASKIPVLTASPGTPDGTKVLRDDGTWTPQSVGVLSNVLFVRKTSDVTRTSTTSLADDSELFLALAASKSYIIEGHVFGTAAAAGDLKVQFTVPSGATLTGTGVGSGPTVSTTTDVSVAQLKPFGASDPRIFGGDGSNDLAVIFRIFVRTSVTAGNFTFQWAQGTSSGTGTSVKTDSFFVGFLVG